MEHKSKGENEVEVDNLLRQEHQKQLERNGGPSTTEALHRLAEASGCELYSAEFAKFLDNHDPVKDFRTKFCIPKMKDLPYIDKSNGNLDEECIYLCGNSLGLKPKLADVYMKEQLENWEKWGVYMHFRGQFPAASCDLYGKVATAKLVGAKPEEIAIMNGLTVNLHLLLIAFYKPTSKRFKIVIEDNAFPSDRYAVISQLRLHGYSAEQGLISVKPQQGEFLLRTEDMLQLIQEEGDSIAVILLPGVQYYTGQKLDMAVLTAAGQARGCAVGWDLAHAIGNVEIRLHDWGVDFSCWCTYKYLNSGAGCIAGAFVHEKHAVIDRPHLQGWWGNKEDTRFQMKEVMDPKDGVQSFRLSNPPPFLVALNMASLQIFDQTNMATLCLKQFFLTGYLELLLLRSFSKETHTSRTGDFNKNLLTIISPSDPQHRGCQLSVMLSMPLEKVFDQLQKRGVVCDLRPPNVMRLAPVPLYNSFLDVWRFTKILADALTAAEKGE